MKNIVVKAKDYLVSSFDELINNVTWPNRSELTSSAVVVLIASLLLALVVFFMDYTLEHFVKFVYKLLY
ncbi:MAG: preprotein translocase subunit SecE [Paludibacteraceae bacterium]|nr:preprotein translocase subunit SecE [Paludibacteraceae bacterium]MBR4838898.1 preprotein translocase subunit SecE [Paludibacteraceae bacterium]